MIKVRVDWQSQCPKCGTQLVVDFFDKSVESSVCPWCGCTCAINRQVNDDALRQYMMNAIQELEKKANTKAPA